jgi:hypothetical protein
VSVAIALAGVDHGANSRRTRSAWRSFETVRRQPGIDAGLESPALRLPPFVVSGGGGLIEIFDSFARDRRGA